MDQDDLARLAGNTTSWTMSLTCWSACRCKAARLQETLNPRVRLGPAERKLSEMNASVAEAVEEIQGLQGQRAKLLAQLETVELALTKVRARKVRG